MTKEELIKAVSEERAKIIYAAFKKLDAVKEEDGAMPAIIVVAETAEAQDELLERAYVMCDEHKIDRMVLGADEFFEACDVEIERLKAGGS